MRFKLQNFSTHLRLVPKLLLATAKYYFRMAGKA